LISSRSFEIHLGREGCAGEGGSGGGGVRQYSCLHGNRSCGCNVLARWNANFTVGVCRCKVPSTDALEIDDARLRNADTREMVETTN